MPMVIVPTIRPHVVIVVPSYESLLVTPDIELIRAIVAAFQAVAHVRGAWPNVIDEILWVRRGAAQIRFILARSVQNYDIDHRLA